jgi:hypothetical protein
MAMTDTVLDEIFNAYEYLDRNGELAKNYLTDCKNE